MEHPDETPFADLERELRVLIRRASSSGAAIARRVHPDLEASAYPLLAHVDSNPGVRGSDLATHFGVGRATVSRQLARLEELGLIQREVDPEDSRGQLLTLTDEGAARFADARERRIASLSQGLATWDVADVATLAGLLHRYSEDVVRWQSENPA
ncbi:DNA-binding MarR family transcriptional regulator [Sediminihabitans luteus]|uniref:DNA-binding MarR family transcriptional regulator n=1 Tax=Sediminihabitans luteus TaxID=1138585 RepID=A0A2M9D063_9CELL|nr:MarR family transcriptional regulator [Sediminihabitans luteus]PJJ77571.1 DNA-binding MarR family transcriptional regulator [Sediminihabitans luteus]GII98471.1 transcriptional regulator [Sediminihabitans luteus]